MFEALARAVEELEVPTERPALAEVWALLDRLTAKATMAAAALDEHALWDVDADMSMTGWLRHHTGMTSRDAALVTRTGKRLRCAPSTAAAWLNGDLASGQVAAVVANVHDETAVLWAQHESGVLPSLTPLPVHQVAAAMRVWAQRAEALVESSDGREGASSLHLSRTLDDRAELTGSFSPELADLVTTALRVGTTGTGPVSRCGPLPNGGPRRWATSASSSSTTSTRSRAAGTDHTSTSWSTSTVGPPVTRPQRGPSTAPRPPPRRSAACSATAGCTGSSPSAARRSSTTGRGRRRSLRRCQRAGRARRALPLGRLRPLSLLVRRAPRAPLGGRRSDPPR